MKTIGNQRAFVLLHTKSTDEKKIRHCKEQSHSENKQQSTHQLYSRALKFGPP